MGDVGCHSNTSPLLLVANLTCPLSPKLRPRTSVSRKYETRGFSGNVKNVKGLESLREREDIMKLSM